MDWLVKNAQSRDVERQHLNKILQEIRNTIDLLQARLSQDSTTEAKIRAVVAQMVSDGTKRGITVTYNSTSKAIDFAINPFTIQLVGDVTGTGNFTGQGGVTITTTLSEQADGVEEAPNDGLPYWRQAEAWVQVPYTLLDADNFFGPGLVYIDADGNWIVSELVAGDNIAIDYSDPSEIVISSTSSGGVLPVVTGEVPPVLVYFDDGSLLYAPAEY